LPHGAASYAVAAGLPIAVPSPAPPTEGTIDVLIVQQVRGHDSYPI
jgi:hypothetical protein